LPVVGSHSRTLLSALAEASSWPSGEKSTQLTSAVWPVNLKRSLPSAVSSRRIVLSALPLASTLPSRPNASERTAPVCPCPLNDVFSLPLPTSQSRTTLSPPPPLASSWLSGEKATARAVLCPLECTCFPVYGSHQRTVLSPLALATVLPSGLKATPKTLLVWPLSI